MVDLKPCLHPRANHQHGTYLAFRFDGCHCPPCTEAHRIQSKRTAHRTVTGTHSYVPADQARTHVLTLLDAGLMVSQIEQRSGVHRTAIRVLIGDFPGRPASKRITRTTHTALLATRPDRVGPEATGLVDPTGARRRLQALMALGWTSRYLCARLGMSTATIPKLTLGDASTPIFASTRAAVIGIYDELSLTIPATSRGRTRARNLARQRGWVPPLAWDDDTIDDPSTRPDLGQPSRRDLFEDYAWLTEAGESHDAALKTLGVTHEAFDRAKHRAAKKSTHAEGTAA